MAGGIHASSPGSATVTHQMGHSAFPPEYTLHSQTVLENGVSVNENSHNGETSTSRKRKLSTDAASHQLDFKRTCIYNHLLSDMIIEKEKYLYISLLDKYRCGEETDFFNFVDKINYSDTVLPFPNPRKPKLTYLSNEPDYFKTALPNDVLISGFKVIKQESNESTRSSPTDLSSKPFPSVVVIRPTCRTSNHVGDSPQQVAEKAKQEAYVLQRVADLQKCGLWSEKRLPKIQEPPRIKTHWDYVLEELEWLATDFAQERKWKKAAAKKRSRMVQKHFQEREALVQKAAKAAELQKKKISGHLAKMVQSFWSSVEKLADFKQEIKLKEKRKNVLDQRFSFITEKFSSVENANKSHIGSSQDLNRLDLLDGNSDAEFEPYQSSSDDEETIEAEENSSKTDVVDPDKEIEILKRESELPIEDLLNQLPEEYLNSVETNLKINDRKHIDDNDEYEMDIDESDDESTLSEEEKIQRNVDYKSEIAELEADNKLSVEDLKKKYNVNCAAVNPLTNYMISSYSESSSDDSREDSSMESSFSDNEISNDTTDDDQSDENDNDDDGLLLLLKDNVLENGDLNDEEDIAAYNKKINDIAATAECLQPQGITLSSTRVISKVPFLLKHSLREYQHIGMDWLVAMYERNFNCILADETGLGKTTQTIALLAHLAAEKEEWGPHLIIVPTSVMPNWEMELKKWCPAFKILTYYGNSKERKLKRSDWTDPNTFHVCITSYELVLKDHRCFRHKKWKYVILDEPQNIKNFKSQRWQQLLNFDSKRRLLLTGKPLLNNLTELWSWMNFLMPDLLMLHREFKEWFSNPVTSTSDSGNSEYNENLVRKLLKILKPFLLRRSKLEVEKQLPKRNEEVIMCELSNRQRYLYDDYMSRNETKETLSSGNLLNVIDVLMQLRKVCNHPNLLEPRSIVSSFQMDSLNYHTASLIDSVLDYQPFEHVNLKSLNLRIVDVEEELTAWSVHRMRKLCVPKKLIEEIDDVANEPPVCPKEAINLRLKVPHDLSSVKLNNNNSKINQKVASFFKNITATVSQASCTSNTTVNSSSVGASSSKVKLGPIYRGVIAQGEINNMAVKRSKLMDNTSNNKGGNLTLQLKTTKFNTVPQKICITTTSSKTPIHATVLKNVLPVTLKNTQTGGHMAESGNGVFGGVSGASLSSASATNVSNTTSTVVASTSTSYASGSGTTAVTLPTVMVSTSVISIAPAGNSPSTKLSNSISQIVQNSGGKSVILATSNSVNKPLTSTATMKTSGQKVILKNIGPGNLNTILGPIIRKPSAQQATILNNGSNAVASSSIILNNTQKTSITIPKPISTFVTSTVAVSTVTSSVSQSDTVSTTVGVSNRNNRDGVKASKDEILFDNQSELDDKRIRREKLRVLGEINERKSSPYVMFGCDVRNTLKILNVDNDKCPAMNDPHYWKCAGHANCINAQYAKHVYGLCYTLTNALSNSVKSIEERIEELSDTFSRFIVYVPSVNARRPSMRVSRPSSSKRWSLKYMECMLEKELAPRSEYLRQIVSRMSTSFPDNRLIQQDCGKLQTLDTLLRRLKVEQHRVLIFTQMARMLDVLEAFLTFRGHIYLRLDGGTKIDQRQILAERFNADERYFCFILSTRFGGIGVNLTGADTVIFYDSDWNPTMDAQTLDRCHRIGLTKDLNIYKLLSEKTVEENMAKKTNQKKLLAEMAAIDDSNLKSARLKPTTIRDLFDVDANESDSAAKANISAIFNADNMLMNSQNMLGKSSTTLFSTLENILATVEDEADANASKLAKEETLAKLNEFDESVSMLSDDEICHSVDDSTTGISEAEQTVDALLEQLTPIERWALRFMESSDDIEWPAGEHLAAVAVAKAARIDQKKKEWEIERFATERAEKKSKRLENEDEENDIMVQLMYSSEDSKNQAWLSFETMERMPIWLPLPPLITIEENEEYIDRSLNYLYETSVPMPEHLLPPVYFRKEKKKLRLDQPSPNINESPSHIRVRSRHREGLNATLSVAALEPPKSLFDRPSPVVAKLRQDMRLQKYRGLSRSTVPNVPGLKPYFPPKINADPEFVPEWLIHEDYALLQAIQHVQELPLNLSVMYPGHTPNWDLVSELVNQVSRIYRSPQQCKNRFETAILPREEGKLTSDPIWKKQKKMKGANQLVTQMKYTRNYKTAQLYVQDSNSTYTQMMNARFEAIRGVSNRRAPTLKRLPLNTTTKNPKHAQLLAECEIDYERPLTPVEIAAKRAQRLAKEKQTQMASAEQHSQPRPSNANVLAGGQQQPQQHLQVAAKPAIMPQAAAVQQVAVAQQQQLQTQTPVAVHKSISIPTSSIVPQPTAVVVNISQNSPVTTSPVTIRSIVHRPLNVQEMIVAGSTSPQQQSSIVIPSTKTTVAGTTATNVLSPSIQRIIPITQISTSTTATGQRIVTAGSKTLTSPQLQLYRQQNAVQFRQQQLKILHSRGGGKTSVVVPANINMVVTSQSQQQQQQQQPQPVVQQGQAQTQQQLGVQVQQQQPTQQTQQQSVQPRQLIKSVAAGTIATSTTRNITEAEMAVLIKKQQQQQQQQQIAQQQKIASGTVIVTSNATSTPTQFITAQSTSATVQNTVGVTLPTIKTTNIKATPTTAHQIRQIQQHILAQQRKLSAQKITPIGQVMVNVTQSGQVISHVLTKTTSGNVASAAQLMGARVIPVVTSNSVKQTFQVVSASQLRATNNASNVNVDATGAARHIQQNLPPNAIKISGGTSPVSVAALTHPQNFLNQVSAAIQNNAPLAVRPGNLRIQNATLASGLTSSATSGNTVASVANVAAAATTATAASPSPNNNSNPSSATAAPSNNEKI